MKIQHFFDPDTSTLTYVVADPTSRDAVVIDPVLDFDPASGKIEDKSLKQILSYVKRHNLIVRGLLETHAHADHLTGSHLLKEYFPDALTGVGERIKLVQNVFKNLFNLQDSSTDGSQFDLLFQDFEEVRFGTLKMKAIPTPGHTPACMSYLFEDAIFTGDAVFMPDSGTGRCDFPGGSAKELYRSVHKNLYSLPDETRVFVGHDYSPQGREMRFETTIGDSKRNNIHLRQETTEEEFVNLRETRDKTLKAPRLLLPSLQINIEAGRFPPKEDNNRRYLKLPLTLQLDDNGKR